MSELKAIRPLPARVPALDGVRGVAVVLVVLLHVSELHVGGGRSPLDAGGWFSGGFIGVDIFFVLSGFLITSILVREHQRTGRLDLVRFWRARILRLVPALLLLLAAFALYSVLADHPGTGDPSTMTSSIVAALTFTINWKGVSSPETLAGELGHLWSLSIEEQFYLLWPLVLLGLVVVVRRRRVIIGVMGATFALVALRRYQLFSSDGWLSPYLHTDAHVDGLIAGAVGALFVSNGTRLGPVGRYLASAAVAVLGAIVLFTPNSAAPFLYKGGLSLVAICAAIVVVVLAGDEWLVGRRVFELRPLRALGMVSYGIYLWHFLVIKVVVHVGQTWTGWLRLVVALISTACAVLFSWFVVERPAFRWRYRLDRRRGRELRSGNPQFAPVTWIFVSVGAASVAISAFGGLLQPVSAVGANLPHYSSLRADAFLNLWESPTSGQTLADATAVGGSGAFDAANLVTTLLRVPVQSTFAGLNDWFLTISLAGAWAFGVIAIGLLTREIAQRAFPASPTSRRRLRSFAVSAAAAVWGLSYFFVDRPQNIEPSAWLIVAVVLLLWSAMSFLRTGKSFASVVASATFVALCQPVAGVVACVIGVGLWGWRARPQFRRVRLVGLATILVLPLLATTPGIDRATGKSQVAATSLGWQLPEQDQEAALFVSGDCRGLYNGRGSVAVPWAAAGFSWLRFILDLSGGVKGSGSARLLRFIGQPRTDLIVRTTSSTGKSRFELDRDGAANDEIGPWINTEFGRRLAVRIDVTDGSFTVTADGHSLGSIPFRDANSTAREPALLYAELPRLVALGIRLEPLESIEPALCDQVLTSLIGRESWSAALPDDPSQAGVRVVGACASLLARAEGAVRPWTLVVARSLEFDVTTTEDQLGAFVQPLATSSVDGLSTLSIESDRSGQIRYRIDGPYRVVGDWTKTLPGTTHRVALRHSGELNQYFLLVDGKILGSVPAAALEPTGRNSIMTPFWWLPSEPASIDGVRVQPVQTELPDLCEQVIQETSDYVTADRVDAVDVAMGESSLVLVGDCVGLWIRTGERWMPVELRSVLTRLAPSDEPGGQASERVILRASVDPLMRTLVEYDGDGRARIVVSVPFLRSEGLWFAIDRTEAVTIRVRPHIAGNQWIIETSNTTATGPEDWVEVGRLPIIVQTSGDDPPSYTFIEDAADDHTDIQMLPTVAPAACSALRAGG